MQLHGSNIIGLEQDKPSRSRVAENSVENQERLFLTDWVRMTRDGSSGIQLISADGAFDGISKNRQKVSLRSNAYVID
jgi:hypothetical protein